MTIPRERAKPDTAAAAWAALTSAQRRALVDAGDGHRHAQPTLRVLRAAGLLDGDNDRTPRGQALVDWVIERGLYR